MRIRSAVAGYTLLEVIVALLVFTVGALSLAASSALVAQTLAMNSLRERGERIALSRIAIIKSQCAIAASGRETVREIESAWSVARPDALRVIAIESVSYMSPRGARTETYRTAIWCRG
jgi:prepilin-type N-terminal cleavage/methylation domain-containing protein